VGHLVILFNDLRVGDRTAVLDNAVVTIIALRAATRTGLSWHKDLFVLPRLASSLIAFSSTAIATTGTLPLALTLSLLSLALTLSLTLTLLPLALILVLRLRVGAICG